VASPVAPPDGDPSGSGSGVVLDPTLTPPAWISIVDDPQVQTTNGLVAAGAPPPAGWVDIGPPQVPDLLYPGSRSVVQLAVPGDQTPLTLPLDPETIEELVEHWYRTSSGWSRVDAVLEAADVMEAKMGYAFDPSRELLGTRAEEYRALARMLRGGIARLAPRIASQLEQLEQLARQEVKWRVWQTAQILGAQLGRLAPSSAYRRYLSDEGRLSLDPQRLSAELRDDPFAPEVEAAGFVELRSLVENLARARNWADSVQLPGAIILTLPPKLVAVAMGLIDLAPPEDLAPARGLLARVQEIADLMGGGQESTAPVTPLEAPGVLLSAVNDARHTAAAAAQLYLIVQAATLSTAPILRFMDLPALDGADDAALSDALAGAVKLVADAAAVVWTQMPKDLSTTLCFGDDRPDRAAGGMANRRDSFSYPPAVFAALESAGLDPGSLAFSAAGEALATRGAPSLILDGWKEITGGLGMGALLVEKAGPAAAVSTAALSLTEAIQHTVWFSRQRTTYRSTLDPALSLVEEMPEVIDVVSKWGWASLDMVFAVMEIAALSALSA